MTVALLALNFLGIFKGLLMFLFILCALLLTVVVLLQEPKGGGLSSAFGGAGAETFGVQTGGVNKFTSWVAGIFMGLAILYAALPDASQRAPSELVGPVEEEASEDPPPAVEEAPPSEAPPAEEEE